MVTPYHPGCGHIGSKNTLATVHKLERINQTAHIFFLKALCGSHGDPRKCPALWGAFFHMPARSSGECGVKNGTWCLQGKDSAGSPGNDYYAVCAIDGELPYFDSIPSNLNFSVALHGVATSGSSYSILFIAIPSRKRDVVAPKSCIG